MYIVCKSDEGGELVYTKLVNVQIIISLLKQHGVHYLVLSPGNRDVPLVHSVEDDDDFKCFSIVDERSAAFFALGLSESMNEPVGFVCTSSTASANFMPAIQEAARRNIKLVALTADRENYYLNQMEDQKINQTNMYAPYTKYCADLPVVRNDLDEWLCVRKVNEALLALNDTVTKPVHINFQVNRTDQFTSKKLPIYRKINKISDKKLVDDVGYFRNVLSQKHKILVVVGEYYLKNEHLSRQLIEFQEKYNSVVISNHFSNLNGPFLKSILALETMTLDEFKKFSPDLVINLGGHIWSSIKYKLRELKEPFEHWMITDDPVIRDGLKRLTNIFNVSPEKFFELMNDTPNMYNSYYKIWHNKVMNIKFPKLNFSNFSVIKDIMSKIPENSIVHTSILNSARLNDFSDYEAKNIKTYCNFGAEGIDGCMSTFLGQTDGNKGLSFLIIGDLSFLYDLNVSLEKFGNDKRILLINNHGGSEFHTSFGLHKFKSLNQHIAAKHNTNIKDCIDVNNFVYLSAATQEELYNNIDMFVSKSDKPIILEIFTDADLDGKVTNEFYKMNRILPFNKKIEYIIKKIIKKILRM